MLPEYDWMVVKSYTQIEDNEEEIGLLCSGGI